MSFMEVHRCCFICPECKEYAVVNPVQPEWIQVGERELFQQRAIRENFDFEEDGTYYIFEYCSEACLTKDDPQRLERSNQWLKIVDNVYETLEETKKQINAFCDERNNNRDLKELKQVFEEDIKELLDKYQNVKEPQRSDCLKRAAKDSARMMRPYLVNKIVNSRAVSKKLCEHNNKMREILKSIPDDVDMVELCIPHHIHKPWSMNSIITYRGTMFFPDAETPPNTFYNPIKFSMKNLKKEAILHRSFIYLKPNLTNADAREIIDMILKEDAEAENTVNPINNTNQESVNL